jgi:membrane-associated protease RseP (regulator of RpoE activity)
MILGLIFLGGAIINMREIHHPLWFWIVGVLIFLPSAYFGALLAAPREGASTAR